MPTISMFYGILIRSLIQMSIIPLISMLVIRIMRHYSILMEISLKEICPKGN